jgi:hypothetical protein
MARTAAVLLVMIVVVQLFPSHVVHAAAGGAMRGAMRRLLNGRGMSASAGGKGVGNNDDCVGAWGPWGECSASCDGGSRRRTYAVAQPASKKKGAPCVEDDGEQMTEACGTAACPVDCQSEWSEWGECPVTCGGSWQTRTLSIVVQPANDGLPCRPVDGADAVRTCGTEDCLVED